MVFSFDQATGAAIAVKNARAREYVYALGRDLELFAPGTLASFLTNHDRNRTRTEVGAEGDGPLKAAAAMLLTGPGVPFIYYGEEVGMAGKKPDEDLRTPMQWSPGQNAGFTSGVPWRPPNDDFRERNVASHTAAPDSLLSWYRYLIGLRRERSSLRRGTTYLPTASHRAVYSVLRHLGDDVLLVVINLAAEGLAEPELELATSDLAPGGYRAVPLLSDGEAVRLRVNRRGGFEGFGPRSRLAPYEVALYQLER
jgi:glycosidase